MHSIFIAACISLYLVVSTTADAFAYSSNGYQLVIYNNDPNFHQDTRQRLIDTFFATMPQMCSRFNPYSCSREVFLLIEPNYNGVAYASGNVITASATWFQNNPQDTDVLTHEGMHVVQSYSRYDPSWLVEGIADYVRWKYGQNNAAAGWSLPDYSDDQHYTNSYRVTARFLAWCEKYYSTIVNQLDSALRSNTYDKNTWSQITGKSLEQLWFDYSRNPAL